jgi:hypothetical protein
MAEYITKEQAYNSVDERIDELRADKEFNIVKEICISGVKKHIEAVPTTDVVEREKIDKAIRIAKDSITTCFKLGLNERAFGMREILEIFEENMEG